MCIEKGRSKPLVEYPKYSIVIPAYNESARIPATLESVVAVCPREPMAGRGHRG